MATHDPNSRLTEGTGNTPYDSPNGVTEQQGSTARAGSAATGSSLGGQHEESAGEKIGRFFRRAMDRISGREEDDDWRRGNERNVRDRETQERYRAGDKSWQYGRSALRDRGQSEWSDLGRSRDDRNWSYRSGPSGDTAGSYERIQGSLGGCGSAAYGQGTTGRPYGQGQGSYGQESHGQGGYERDQSRFGYGSQGQSGQGSYNQQGQGSENRGGQSLGQRGLGRSPGESYGLGEVPDPRPIGSDRGFQGDQGRDDWNRGQERWRERGQSGASGMSYAGAGAGFGFGRDEQRAGEWSETARDRDQGQGRRFWQREPLAARDVMTRNPKTVTRQSAVREAAIVMRDENCGAVPVVDGAGRLEGILTDRDIVVRGLVDETGNRRVEDVMTDDVSAVTEDEPLTSVLDVMGRKQVRRVPVVDRNDRLLGIISMADIANRADYDEDLQDAFERISSRRSFWSLFS